MIQVCGGLIDTVPPKSNNCGTRLYDDDINGHVVKKKQLKPLASEAKCRTLGG
jgi:hypothetical protein